MKKIRTAAELQERLQKREQAIEAREDRKINAASRRAAARIIRRMRKTGYSTIEKELLESSVGKWGQVSRTLQLLEEAGYRWKRCIKEGFGQSNDVVYYVIVTPDQEKRLNYHN